MNIDNLFHAFMTQGVLEELVNSFSAAADGICKKIMKICCFQIRIGNKHIYTYRESVDILLQAFMTQGVLEELVNSFSAAADGICS